MVQWLWVLGWRWQTCSNTSKQAFHWVSYQGGLPLTFFLSQVNSTLKQLQLSWNGFGHIETESLGQALKHNSTLVSLDLSSNRIDDQAVTLLCQGLAINEALMILKVSRQKGNFRSTGFYTLKKKSGFKIHVKCLCIFEALPQPDNKYWGSDAAQNSNKQHKICTGGDRYFCKCSKLISPQWVFSVCHDYTCLHFYCIFMLWVCVCEYRQCLCARPLWSYLKKPVRGVLLCMSSTVSWDLSSGTYLLSTSFRSAVKETNLMMGIISKY